MRLNRWIIYSCTAHGQPCFGFTFLATLGSRGLFWILSVASLRTGLIKPSELDLFLQRKMWVVVLAPVVCGALWEERDRRIFEDAARKKRKVLDSILSRIFYWLFVWPTKRGAILVQLVVVWLGNHFIKWLLIFCFVRLVLEVRVYASLMLKPAFSWMKYFILFRKEKVTRSSLNIDMSFTKKLQCFTCDLFYVSPTPTLFPW